MVKRKNEFKFPIKDKLLWWGSNLLGLAASFALLLAFIILLPFRRYESFYMRFFIRIAAITLVIGLITGAYLYYIPHQAAEFGKSTKYIMVERGETAYDIGFKFQRIGAISSEFNFMLFAKIVGHSRHIKAGRYAVEPGMSLADIFKILTTGAAVPFNITIPEGLTVKETADLLAQNLAFGKDEFIPISKNRLLLDSLSIPTDDVEGYLFPDTYNFFYDESPDQVIRKMVARFYETLPDSFEIKAKRHGLDFYEAVTMASLIESEAMLDSERPLISAVYHSRLKKVMRLQCDPTVIYALGGLGRPLYYRDLEVDSPYNTYKYYGLPPGPICSPGRASLEAAVNPAAVAYLYFVAAGDGSHIFSDTHQGHINAKNKVKRDRMLGRAG